MKVRETIAGMEAIREATETAEEVIRNLGARAVEIGAIVDVIDDVADETNLLALNAAIIAAQSGDHGRAFSVVAEEIKDLAERVLASTKEIGGLIRSVQEEAGKATARSSAAASRWRAASTSRPRPAWRSRRSLRRRRTAARGSRDRVVAARAGEGGRSRRRPDGARAQRRRRDPPGVRRAEPRQRGGVPGRGDDARGGAPGARHHRGAVARIVRIRESVEGVREAVERINSALQEQSLACSAAADFLEEVRGRGVTHEEATRTVEGVARELLAQAEELREEVRRFACRRGLPGGSIHDCSVSQVRGEISHRRREAAPGRRAPALLALRDGVPRPAGGRPSWPPLPLPPRRARPHPHPAPRSAAPVAAPTPQRVAPRAMPARAAAVTEAPTGDPEKRVLIAHPEGRVGEADRRRARESWGLSPVLVHDGVERSSDPAPATRVVVLTTRAAAMFGSRSARS
jgi:hypothetical protein